VSREFKCCAGCTCCACSDMCSMEIQVEAPVGQVIGYVKQQSVMLRAFSSVLSVLSSLISVLCQFV